MHKLLIVCGPTATGKTNLAVLLARKYNGELISADSRQIYKGLNILTGKDLEAGQLPQASLLTVKYKERQISLSIYEINGIKVWMYDVADISSEFSVAHYQFIANRVMEDIWKRGKLPIVVGGTGLYLSAITNFMDEIQIPPDKKLRIKLSKMTVDKLQEKLQLLNSNKLRNMNNSDKNNPRRLIRAIEICLWQKNHTVVSRENSDKDVLWIGLTAPLSMIKDRIEQRVKQRWQAGATQEVKQLVSHLQYTRGLGTTLGFVPLTKYVLGEISEKQAVTLWKDSELNYAKRQLTWFKKQANIQWFDISKHSLAAKAEAMVKTWYTK